MPGVVSTLLARKIPQAQLQAYCLTGEPFGAAEAVQLELLLKTLTQTSEETGDA